MESAVRYDFSFPPKSTSLNNTNSNSNSSNNSSNSHYFNHHSVHSSHHHNSYQRHGSVQLQHQISHDGNQNSYNNHNSHGHQVYHHNNNNNLGLSKSASTSLLSCVMHNNNNSVNINNNNLTNGKNNPNYCNSCSSNCSNTNVNAYNNNNNINKKSGSKTCSMQYSNANHPGTIGAPATPKDGNCSFTFDDLKNTLAFMEDSPLINTTSTNNASTNLNSNSTQPGTTTNTVQQQLMVIANAHQSGDSSVSSLSSASSTSSSSSSCYVPPYIPKSTSNPMLLSIHSSTSTSTNTNGLIVTSPLSSSTNSVAAIQNKESCGCHNSASVDNLSIQPTHNHSNYNSNMTAKHSVLDILIRKPPQAPSSRDSNSDENNHHVVHHVVHHGGHHHNGTYSPSGNNSLITTVQQNTVINTAVENAAKKYRCAAQISEATCCWKGKLPPKQYKTPIVYSTKVFVGGLPWDITEEDLIKEFGIYGPCRVEWTNKEKYNLLSNSQQDSSYESSGSNRNNNNNRSMSNLQSKQNNTNNNTNSNNNNNINSNNSDSVNSSKQRMSPGFAYVIYESEYSVRSLVGNCIEDYQNGRDRVEYYFKISTRRVRNKEVQIIPWILADNNFALCTPKDLDPKKTVFVGNLHGTMTARDLAHIMNELFGCVVYAGIDIDKLKYPIGSGRVTFSHQQNFMRAVRAAFVDIQSSKFSKRIQIDPYLEDVQCCVCYGEKGIYFCRDFQCFNYYCGSCWEKQHSYSQMGNHKPLMRKREDKII